MSEIKHTPGPWRWEINLKSRSIQLCGGKPRFDLTVMDFVRWGMGGAQPRFRSPKDIMKKSTDFTEVVDGREHHADWFQNLSHPDANLIAAAPDLLAALINLLDDGDATDIAAAHAAIAKAGVGSHTATDGGAK